MESNHSAPGRPPATTDSFTVLHRIIDLDTSLSLILHRISQPLPRFILLSLELSGDGRFFFPIIISLFFIPSFCTNFCPILFALVLGGVLDLLFVGIMKHAVQRPRPIYNKGMSLAFSVDQWSFPSGHASRVFCIASLIYLSSDSIERSFTYYGMSIDSVLLCIWLWAVVTSLSRVLLGRHFIFDILAGACLGVLEGILVFWFVKVYKFGLYSICSVFFE